MTNWYSTFIQSLIQDRATEDNISLSSFQGCSTLDLELLQKSQRVKQLPEIYRQFMLQMGNGFASRSDDMLWTVNELLNFKKQEISLISQDKFIFMWHEEVFTLYGFSTAEDYDNPEILIWDEAHIEHQTIETGDKLSEFLISFFAPDFPS